MKNRGLLSLAAMILVVSVAWAQAPNASQAGLEKMKSLAGVWQGTAADGQAATVTYRVTSNGSVVEERIQKGAEEMVTMYYADGARLVMTHYCAAKNQPRMAAGPLTGNRLEFKFVDATNLPSPDTGHMHGLVITFVDSTNITQQWTWREKGKADATDMFRLSRKKP